jgi:hypothetical protein
MKNLKLTKGLVALSTAALIAAFTVAVPTVARAADDCQETTILSGIKVVR